MRVSLGERTHDYATAWRNNSCMVRVNLSRVIAAKTPEIGNNSCMVRVNPTRHALLTDA